MTFTLFAAGQKLTGASLNAALTALDRDLLIVKPSIQTVNNSATLIDDTDLLVALAANSTYVFEAFVLFTTGATPDIKYGFTFPAGATCQWGSIRMVTSSAGATGDGDWGSFSSATSGTSVVGAAGTGSAQMALVMGSITTSATSGNLRLTWAQNTANASDTSIYPGSWLWALKQ